jgi:hypothetical protein
VLDEAAAYWSQRFLATMTHSGYVWKVAKTGARAAVALTPKRSPPRGIAVDDRWVYWTEPEAGAVLRAAKGGP